MTAPDVGLGDAPSLLRELLRFLYWLHNRIGADHSTITTGWFTKAFPGHRNFYVNVGCAPSRKREWKLTPVSARRYVERVFPEVGFPERPNQAMGDQVAFEVAGEPGDDPFVRAIRMYNSGLIELTWRLPLVGGCLEEGAILSVSDMLEPLRWMVAAVHEGAYAEMYSRWPKLDWFFAVSPSVNHDRGWSPWGDLEFPGARPEDRATRQHPNIPSQGYAADRLRRLDQRTKPERIIEIALGDMLQQCGFYGIEQAVSDAVRSGSLQDQ